MRAATLNAPEDLRLVEKEKPTPGKNEVLLKIEANTMCGTDYRLYTGAKTSGISYGTVTGHEIAGRRGRRADSTRLAHWATGDSIDRGIVRFLPQLSTRS